MPVEAAISLNLATFTIISSVLALSGSLKLLEITSTATTEVEDIGTLMVGALDEEEAIDWKLSDLADLGKPEMRLQRVVELFRCLDSNEGKISNDEFRELTIDLLSKYPA